MESLWNDKEAAQYGGDLLDLRVYTSRLLGRDEDLVLHGGGNTSVKIREKNIFGREEDILYVKGSGWDLATIERPGFAPVKLDVLLDLAELPELTDNQMVKYQRMAMTDPSAPNPSVEAILHGIIPFAFVDHTHADAVVTISNTPGGEERIRELFGDRLLIVPYVMPGFILARTIYEMTRDIDWSEIEGMILLNHGVFSFNDDPKKSYEKMIAIVDEAEKYIVNAGIGQVPESKPTATDNLKIARIRKAVSQAAGRPMLARLNDAPHASGFSALDGVADMVSRGPLTPDHIIRTKRVPVVIGEDVNNAVDTYVSAYGEYFREYEQGETVLDPAPRWAVLPGAGSMVFGPTPKHMTIIDDITSHTMKAIYQAEQLGGWKALPGKDLFEVEYWELEQAKLRKAGTPPEMQGKVALVTGAASGIGKACVDSLVAAGAVVTALDIDPRVENLFSSAAVLGIPCDVTDRTAVQAAIGETVRKFGGLDMIVSNAGIFPPSMRLEDMSDDNWNRSMELNLNSHRRLITDALPFLSEGFDPAIVLIGSKNVPAPGPGASAYSVAKAGLTQLARVAALELGDKGIRINVIHPNAVFDTGIWTEEVLRTRAEHYGLTVEEYKTNNILHVEVTSRDVGDLSTLMLGKKFAKTTGAQVPIDGGNERII